MRFSHLLSRFGFVLVTATALLALSSGTALTSPAPQQTVWRLLGEENFEQSAVSIANAGDVDHDGVDDVVVGLRTVSLADIGNHTAARVYSGADGAQLFGDLPAPPALDQPSNNVVAGLGDLNGDGKSEVIVGTPLASVGLFGANGVVRVHDVANGTILKEWAGGAVGNFGFFGASLDVIGDVDNDGVRDLLIGAPGADYVFVYSGNPATSFELIDPIPATEVTGSLDTRFGASVAHVGVIDASGRTAVVVGAPDHPTPNPGSRKGRIYVILVGDRRVASVLKYTKDGVANGDLFGTDVDGGVDLNGDAIPDFMGSALGTPPEGPPGGGPGYVQTYSSANGALLHTFTSDQPDDGFGFVAKFGGLCANTPTLIVGAPVWMNGNGQRVGRVLVYQATGSGPLRTQIAGEKLLENMGMSVGAFVDLTGDNNAEFLAGAPGTGNPPVQVTVGAAYVFSCVNLPRPDIIAAPNPADFGNVQSGALQDKVVTITNQGTAQLQVAGVALGPGTNPAYSILSGAGAFNLAPAATHEVTVRFNPTSPGLKGGKLRIQSNDPDTPVYDVTLVGKGTSRKIEVTPLNVDFGDVNVNDTATAFVKVKNIGNIPLTVSGVTLPNDGGGLFSLALLPPLPKTLQAGQHFLFQTRYTPTSIAGASGTVNVASDDPDAPNVQVPLTGNGVAQNLRPTAVITMEVPYNGNVIRLHGDGSFDPDGNLASYAWDFGHDGATSSEMNPVHDFPCPGGPNPCRHIVRLTVTDNGLKSDPTSVTVLAFTRPVRSRFYGTILQGGENVPDGTVVSAYINGKNVAESQTQTHLGKSVYAIEVPPDIHFTGDGGKDGETVTFMYNLATAEISGTFYSKTDQELNLNAPYYVPPFLDFDWCIIARALGLDLCGPPILVPNGGLEIELEEWPRPPIPDPGPLRQIGDAFRLEFADGATGQPITTFEQPYQLIARYTDADLAEAGVQDESTIGLYYVQDNQWIPAGSDTLTPEYNKLTSEVGHASVFALFGVSDKPKEIFLPMIRR